MEEDFDEFTDEEYEDALNVAAEIMDIFVNKRFDICFEALDLCMESLDNAEKLSMQENCDRKTFPEWN